MSPEERLMAAAEILRDAMEEMMAERSLEQDSSPECAA